MGTTGESVNRQGESSQPSKRRAWAANLHVRLLGASAGAFVPCKRNRLSNFDDTFSRFHWPTSPADGPGMSATGGADYQQKRRGWSTML